MNKEERIKNLSEILSEIVEVRIPRSYVEMEGTSDDVKHLSDVEKAYIACAIDCEGTISLRRHKKSWKPYMAITNTNKEFLENIRRMCNAGRIKAKKMRVLCRAGSVALVRYCYDLIFNVREIERLLPQILPYLVIKRERAELLLRYFKLKKEGKRGKIEEIHRKIKLLNMMSRR